MGHTLPDRGTVWASVAGRRPSQPIRFTAFAWNVFHPKHALSQLFPSEAERATAYQGYHCHAVDPAFATPAHASKGVSEPERLLRATMLKAVPAMPTTIPTIAATAANP